MSAVSILTMLPIVCFTLAAFISGPIGAAAAAAGGAATSTSTSKSTVGNELLPSTTSSTHHHQYRIHRSHVFHVEPRAIINSILSDVVRHQPFTQNDNKGSSSSLLDIDLSSTRMDDGSLVSLMEELLPLLKSKTDEAEAGYPQNEKEAHPFSVKLALSMNKITPSGASNMLDMLMLVGKKDDEKDGDSASDRNATANNEEMESSNESSDLVVVIDNNIIDPKDKQSDDKTYLEIIESNENSNNSNSTTTNNNNIEEMESSEADETSTTTSTDAPAEDATIPVVEEPAILMEEIDLSFNDIGGHGIHSPDAKLLNSVRRLFEGERTASLFVPRVLALENCGIGPAFCRSIGRGILNAFERKNNNGANSKSLSCRRPSVLRMGGNDAIGDAGTVALAAALRMAEDASHNSSTDNNNSHHVVLEELDLSSCHVGDAGAEALALALASNPGCLHRLDLSNNKITDAGSKALGRALVDALHTSSTIFEQIILDNNKIGDDGAAALAEALACGAVKSISLRSCSVQAQGAAAFGKAMMTLANRKDCDESNSHFQVDLSGNHFGTRKIKKKKGAAYSASLIRDRASTNIKFIGKTLKGAAKRFGSETMGITADSDDDEEVMGGLIDDEEDEINDDKLRACGGHALAGEILRSDQNRLKRKKRGSSPLKITVGLRQCSLDDGAIDALSATVVGVKNCVLSMDVSMNSAEDDVVDDLMNAEKDSKLLSTMARRHMDLLDRIADARQRQLEAAETSASRVHELGGTFGDEDDFYDGDFDYDPYDDFD